VRLKKEIIALSLLLITAKTHAFGVPDHKMITELAIEELQQCNRLPPILSTQFDNKKTAAQVLIQSDLDEDNYLKNGLKKTFEYSHFYNPLRPLKPELKRAHHADQAVLDYSQNVVKLNKSNSYEILQNAGMIVHMIQDASSPPHVLWINHGPFDGFENKVSINKSELAALKPDCQTIQLDGLQSPIQIMKAAGLATLKELEEPVRYKLDGQYQSAPWTQTFFSNNAAFTKNVLVFLSQFDLAHPNLNSPLTDDNNKSGWNTQYLNRGEYGPFSDEILSPTVRGDHFGSNSFRAHGHDIKVDESEYIQLRKNLLRQSILNTQRMLLWLNLRMQQRP
jgi:hypothetical protein